ncbi:MAG: hypothetical protein K2O45_13885, partial [Oscillospiraceae bacterium]|nr:hypothetical protein [Oscillospiraceae bacterium]
LCGGGEMFLIEDLPLPRRAYFSRAGKVTKARQNLRFWIPLGVTRSVTPYGLICFCACPVVCLV